ncbi:hypothetical protein J2S55_003176 [Streptosporangium brasiliense]|uniref:ABC transporter domain-containing protein n=1 Tax=Streptosporangium brasiliense TaxID=47480 RepID=A0ABT9R3V2_9ACTN|nr:hypothetical protein [Streptosporangium brasiliense]
MRNLAIAANGLRKSYGDKVVLDGVDLTVPEGRSSPCSARTARASPMQDCDTS